MSSNSAMNDGSESHEQPSSQRVLRKSALLSPRLPMDELVSPRLAEEALRSQANQSFHLCLMHYFPRSYTSFNHRVGVNWMDMIHNLQPSMHSHALTWGMRALITFQMGSVHGNADTIYCARHLYARGVRCLRFLLQTPYALTDEALAAAILLGGYEILDGSSEHAWLRHTSGVRQIICARGPAIHKSGIARTLLLSFRPFLVAESFVLGEPCFLGDPDWIGISRDIHKEGEEEGDGGEKALCRAMDYAFDETAKCPGYYAATQAILASQANPDPFSLSSLLDAIAKSKECLLNLNAKLVTILEYEELPVARTQSIPPSDARSLAQLTCGGIASSVALLDQLTNVLQSDQNRRRSHHQARLVLPDGVYEPGPWQASRKGVAVRKGSSSQDAAKFSVNVQSIGDRLDRFSLNMGVSGVSGDSPIQAMQP